MTNSGFKTNFNGSWLSWIAVAVLLALVAGLFATYLLRPAGGGAEDARTADAVVSMDKAQAKADDRREEKRSAAALLN